MTGKQNEGHRHELTLPGGRIVMTGPALRAADGSHTHQLEFATIPAAPRQTYAKRATPPRQEDQRLARMVDHVAAALAVVEQSAGRSHYSTVAGCVIPDDPLPAPERPVATKGAPGSLGSTKLEWSTVCGAYIPKADRESLYFPRRRRAIP